MKIGILSDIHANYPALEAVWRDFSSLGMEKYWMLGDLVGYGPHPVRSLLWLKQNAADISWITGNHDAMMTGLFTKEEWEMVNEGAKLALSLNKDSLNEENEESGEARDFLNTTFKGERITPITYFHDNVEYILSHGALTGQRFMRTIFPWQVQIFIPAELNKLSDAQSQFPRVCFQGHSHVPMLVMASPKNGEGGFDIEVIKVEPEHIYSLTAPLVIINPGAVGQPRDLDRRAAYACLDTAAHTIVFKRVEYDWQQTAQDMLDRDYPTSLIHRLRTAKAPEDTPVDWLEHFQKMRQVYETAV